MAVQIKARRLRRWLGGINNVADVTDIQSFDNRVPSFVRDMVNIDLDNAGKPTRRPGTQLAYPGGWHSAWSDDAMKCCFAVGEGVLYHIDENLVRTPLATVGLRRMSYAYLNGEVYWSNGVDAGVASLTGSVREWGMSDAPGPNASAVGTGGLNAGAYRVAMTYRTEAGEESGATESVTVDVADGGGIQVVVGNLPDDVHRAVFYRSDTNGDRLYKVAAFAGGTHILGVDTLGRQLDTQFMERIPPGDFVRAYNGRLFVGMAEYLMFTRPLRYGLFKLAEDYVRFGAPITFVEPVDTGLYVGTTERTFFLQGDDPKDFKLNEVDLSGAVPGASTRCSGSIYGEQGVPGMAAVWWNRQGRLVVGASNGQISFPTQDHYAGSDFDSGSITLRERDGARHIISLMRGAHRSSGFVARDEATAEVIRNGIVVPPPTVQKALLLDRVRVSAVVDTA